MLAQVFERDRQPVAHLISHRAADIDPARLCQAFQPCGDGDAVAINQVTVGDDVAHIDCDAKPDPPVGRQCGAVLGHRALDRQRTAHRIDDAVEFDQQPVTHGAHDTALVLVDLGVDEIATDGLERGQCALFVDPHQSGIADDVGAHNDRKPVLYP